MDGDRKKPNVGILLTIIFAGGLVALTFANRPPGLAEQMQPAKPAAGRDCQDARAAYYVAQEFVRSRLKSPKTADFPSFSAIQSAYLGDCEHQFAGYVDSQNGFGAELRTNYAARLKYLYTDNKGVPFYRLENLTFRD